MNIAALPAEEQRAIQRDKVTALWAHDVKTGRRTRGAVEMKIMQVPDAAKREDLLNRFTKFMNAKCVNES